MPETIRSTSVGTDANNLLPLLNKADMARLLKKSTKTIERRADAGLLPGSFLIGPAVYWNRDEVLHWIASNCPPRVLWERLHPKYRKNNGGR